MVGGRTQSLRVIAGLVTGIVAAVYIIWLVDQLSARFYPVPEEVSLQDTEQVIQTLGAVPIGVELLVVFAWFSGAMVGSTAAGVISRRPWTSWAVAGAVAVAAMTFMMWIPSQGWIKILSVMAPLLAGYIASKIVPRGPAPPSLPITD